MFNDKRYYEVNREERHFGFMLISELLNNEQFRRLVFSEIYNKCNAFLDPDNFEIYTEVAALRDFWNDLGDAGEYSAETHTRRYETIKEILNLIGYTQISIDNEAVFWTSTDKQKRKLWCPAKWNIEALKKLERNENDLAKIRWSFNAKPDIMIESPGSIVLLELKLESGEGTNINGYNQYEIQKMIGELMKTLIPSYSNFTFHNVSLELSNGTDKFNWKKILCFLKDSKRNTIGFEKVLKTLERLELYY